MINVSDYAEAIEHAFDERTESLGEDNATVTLFGSADVIKLTSTRIGNFGELAVNVYFDDTDVIIRSFDKYVETGSIRLQGAFAQDADAVADFVVRMWL